MDIVRPSTIETSTGAWSVPVCKPFCARWVHVRLLLLFFLFFLPSPTAVEGAYVCDHAHCTREISCGLPRAYSPHGYQSIAGPGPQVVKCDLRVVTGPRTWRRYGPLAYWTSVRNQPPAMLLVTIVLRVLCVSLSWDRENPHVYLTDSAMCTCGYRIYDQSCVTVWDLARLMDHNGPLGVSTRLLRAQIRRSFSEKRMLKYIMCLRCSKTASNIPYHYCESRFTAIQNEGFKIIVLLKT